MMAKYLPMTEAFAKYNSPDEIEAAYPGIFSADGHMQHLRVADDGNWLLEDKHDTAAQQNNRLTADELRAMFAKGGK